MNLTIKYFGMLAEATGMHEETIEANKHTSLTTLRDRLEEKYRPLKKLSYEIAINQSVVHGETDLKENDEIALLPPFSGG